MVGRTTRSSSPSFHPALNPARAWRSELNPSQDLSTSSDNEYLIYSISYTIPSTTSLPYIFVYYQQES